MPSDGRLTLRQLAQELGTSEKLAQRWVRHNRVLADPQGSPPTFDPRCLDHVRALRGEPHRQLHSPARDWLARFLGGSK